MGFSMDIQKINMWRIQVTTRTIVRVCCERCIKVGKVVKDCPMCGGTGVHNKHVVRYEVNPKPVKSKLVTALESILKTVTIQHLPRM